MATIFKREFGTLRGKVHIAPDAFSQKLDNEIAQIVEESEIFPQ